MEGSPRYDNASTLTPVGRVEPENSCFLSGTDIAQIDGDCRFLRLAGFAGDLEEYSLEA